LSLLSCVSSSSDYCLQELGLQLKLGKAHLQTSDADYSLLKSAFEQLPSLPTAQSLYLKAKHLLFNTITSECETHLQTLSKYGDSGEILQDTAPSHAWISPRSVIISPTGCFRHFTYCS